MAYIRENASVSSASAATSTEVVTITAGATAGNTLILISGVRISGHTLTGVTDSRGNTWTLDGGAQLTTNNNLVALASTRQDVATLQTNDTVTLTWNANPGSGRMTVIEEFSGLLTSGYSDGNNTSTGSSITNLTTGSLTTVNANDLIIAAWICGTNASTLTYNNTGTIGTYLNFTTTKLTTTSGFSKDLGMCYQFVTSAAAQASNLLMNATNSINSVIQAYKQSASFIPPQPFIVSQAVKRSEQY